MQPTRRKKQLVTKTITVPANLQKGCDQFNREEFYESHESFEEIWQLEVGAVRDLYRGLIQIAAGFVHLSRGKYIGAERLLRTGGAYLAPYRAEGAMGFDIERVCSDAEDMYARLMVAGRDGVRGLDLSRRPFYQFDAKRLRAESIRWRAWGFDEEGNALEMEITVAE